MSLLASVEDIRMRLTFDEGTTVDNAIEGALQTTTAVLESRLRTKLTRVDQFDEIFQVRNVHAEQYPSAQPFLSHGPNRVRRGGLFANSPLFTLELLLRRGFVSETSVSAMPIVAATLIPHLDDANLRWNIRDFDDGLDHAVADAERGLITIHQLNLTGMFVRVTYNGGLTVASDELFDIPADNFWLKEMAILNTLVILESNPVFRRDDNSEVFMKGVRSDLDLLIRDHVRYVPGAARPMSR